MEIINNRINRIFNQNSFINELDNCKYNISSSFYDDELEIITTPLQYNLYPEPTGVIFNDNYTKPNVIYNDNSTNTETDVIYNNNSTQTTIINTHNNYKKLLYFLIILLLLKQRDEIFNYKKIIKNYLEYKLDISIYKIDTNYYNRVSCALYDLIIHNFKSITILDGKLEGDLSKGVHLTQNITSRMNYYKIIYDRENDDINSTPKYDLDKLQEIYVRFSNNIGKLYTDYIKELEQADQLEINELAGIDEEEEE